MGFSRTELEQFRDTTVPDLLGPGLRLLFVGINPGLWTAATQTHFAHPSNRFYPALRRAGVIEIDVDPAAGLSNAERQHLIERGVGITNLVDRATARASELGAAELRKGVGKLESVVGRHRPEVAAVAGVTAYRTAFGRRDAEMGPQPETVADVPLWVVPNPSGLNAHETIESLAGWYRQVAVVAGVVDR